MDESFFEKAKPVWLKGKENLKHVTAGFVCSFIRKNETGSYSVSIAASSIYRVFLNGTFIGHGPARAAHGFYRVDKISLPEELMPEDLTEENILAVEVAGLFVNSFYTLEQPPFLQAEVAWEAAGNHSAADTSKHVQVLGYTKAHGSFWGMELHERLTKVQRYSFQRPFLEAYMLKKDYCFWRTGFVLNISLWEELAETEDKKLLKRNVPWPLFQIHPGKSPVNRGKFKSGCMEQEIWQDRALFEIGETLHGFPAEELEEPVSMIMDRCKTINLQPWEDIGEGVSDEDCSWTGGMGNFVILDLGRNMTGFLGLTLECDADAYGFLVFDEVLIKGDVQYNRMSCVNAVSLHMEKGSYDWETIQPYTCRYLKFMVMEGTIRIKKWYLRDLCNSACEKASFDCGIPVLSGIFEAARETFAQNAVDLYMDCPSRERAGWLCDSFFTGRVERILTGGSLVEENFLENYLLPESFADIPKGMVPMCYPSDHKDGMFIANWALWLILELYEYRIRENGEAKANPEKISINQSLVQRMESKVGGILGYYASLENEYELAEDIPGWVFVEWSKANELVDGVNFPSNMLYSAALMAAGMMYGNREYVEKGKRIRENIRKLSFDGEWFCDQAVRMDKELIRQKEATEVCQYYAFYFRTADKEAYPSLHKRLMEDFGPGRKISGAFKEIWPANAFIGNYLRMELLSRDHRSQQLLAESADYFHYMAVRTGTLWENTGDYASCNHGFASHICVCFYRDILGVKSISGEEIHLHIPIVDIPYCRGTIPAGDQLITIEWRRTHNQYNVTAHLPKDCRLNVSCEDTSLPVQATFVHNECNLNTLAAGPDSCIL